MNDAGKTHESEISYSLVAPENFTAEQKLFIEDFKKSVTLISSQTDMIFGAKDINSRHFISTDAYAKIVALPKGIDVVDRLDREMPCEGTAQFADCYVQEDIELLNFGDINKKTSVLNIHEYSDGIRARIFHKNIMKLRPSHSIPGTIYSAHEIKIENFFSLIPNYIIEFGIGCSIENIDNRLNIGNEKLTEYEHEVCFLLIMNWSFRQIACFMNKHRPLDRDRVADTISKCRNRICEKLNMPNGNLSDLRDMLIGMGIHRKMPNSFFSRLLGSRPL